MKEQVYTYYPGCSVETSSKGYEQSTQAVASRLGIRLVELEDWNCCGATAYMSVEELPSLAIAARNLALAEPHGRPLVTPCPACFITLKKTNSYLAESPKLKEQVNEALDEAELKYNGTVEVRHLLSVLTKDVGAQAIKAQVKRNLGGLKVACYYGCQIVRPGEEFDNAEMPTTMDTLLAELGAEPVYFPMKTKCCGASLIASTRDVALRLVKDILLCAQQYGAECVVTACPLCQLNLDAYQEQINQQYNLNFKIPVLFITQLIGIALGIPNENLGLRTNIVAPQSLFEKYKLAVERV
jgi:heterodisulfide reductase subunit B